MSQEPRTLSPRVVQLLGIIGLGILGFGHLMGVFVHEPHWVAYAALGAAALGVEMPTLRALLLKFLEAMVSKK
jgi:hypothetical protein